MPPDQARKDPTQRSLEARLRNARYLAELAKFRIASFGAIFSALKTLLDDFAGHNVDAAAALVEAAGRFLYRLPEAHTRMANMLGVRRHMPSTLLSVHSACSQDRILSGPQRLQSVPLCAMRLNRCGVWCQMGT